MNRGDARVIELTTLGEYPDQQRNHLTELPVAGPNSVSAWPKAVPADTPA